VNWDRAGHFNNRQSPLGNHQSATRAASSVAIVDCGLLIVEVKGAGAGVSPSEAGQGW
jgi:hypothetical protein